MADEDMPLVADLIAFGDGGFYCDRIVSPIFECMAFEVSAWSIGNEQPICTGHSELCRPLFQCMGYEVSANIRACLHAYQRLHAAHKQHGAREGNRASTWGCGGTWSNLAQNLVKHVQVDHLSNLGIDVAHRLGYDDFNE